MIQIQENDNEVYSSRDGYVVQREFGLTPNENPINGRWVLRDAKGNWIDFHRSLNDLMEHNNLVLIKKIG